MVISQGRQRRARGASISRGTSLTRGGGRKRPCEMKQRSLGGRGDKLCRSPFRLSGVSVSSESSVSKASRPQSTTRYKKDGTLRCNRDKDGVLGLVRP